MSVLSAIILGMTKWYKKTYVCGLCDALVEISTRSEILKDSNCFECNGALTLLSVVDATIYPTQKKEETNMEQAVASQFLDVVSAKDALIADLEIRIKNLEYVKENLNASVNKYYTKEQQLRSYLMDNYDELEIHANEIAEMFDIALTKEVEYTAWVRVDMTVEVEVGNEFDIEDFISNNLTVDSYGSEVQVTNYEIDRLEEGAY